MKHFLKIARIFTIIFTLTVVASCNNDDDGPLLSEEFSITENALANTNLSILVDALIRTDLANTLDGQGPFTVFAPTNQAFADLLNDLGANSLDDISNDALTDILLNHVVSGKTLSTDLINLGAGYVNTLSTAAPGNNNLSLYFNTSDGVVLNGISEVINPDIEANNGVIHVVDAVITLPTVVTFATADSDLTTLVTALTREDQPDFVGTLGGTTNSPFTVFAPTNQAFGDLLTELNANALSDIDAATLEATLNYHVVAGANVRSTGLSDDLTVTTLGGDITANVTGGPTLTDANERVSNIITTALDIQASNGVIHQIDKVILPPLE